MVRLVRVGGRMPTPGIGEVLVELEAQVEGGRVRGRGAAFPGDVAVSPADAQALGAALASCGSLAEAARILTAVDLPEPLVAAAEGALLDAVLHVSPDDPRTAATRLLLGEEPPPHPRPRPAWIWLRLPVRPDDPDAVESVMDAFAPRYVTLVPGEAGTGEAVEALAACLDRRVGPYDLVLDAAGRRAEDLAAFWQELAGRRRLWRLVSSLLFTEGLAVGDDAMPEGTVRALRPLAPAPDDLLALAVLVERGWAGVRSGPATGPLRALRLRRAADALARKDGGGVPELTLSGAPFVAVPAFVQLLRTALLADLDHLGLASACPASTLPAEAAALARLFPGLLRAGAEGLVLDVRLGRVDVAHVFAPLCELPWPEDARTVFGA